MPQDSTVEDHDKRMDGYSRPTEDGGVHIDVELIIMDLVMVVKAAGIPREDFMHKLIHVWDNSKVEIEIPDHLKN